MTDSDQRSVVESTNAPHGDSFPRARAVAPSSASIGPINSINIPPQTKSPRARSTAPMAFPARPLKVSTFGWMPERASSRAIGSTMNRKACLLQSVNELRAEALLAESGM